MADSTPKSYSTDPNLWLYTSLTSGSSHIITATSRLETILKANKIPFKALDVATDEKARMLWGRRAGKRKLPGLVRMGMVVADLEEVEEWNEYGEIKQNLLLPDANAALATPTPSALSTPSKPAPAAAVTAISNASSPAPNPPTTSAAPPTGAETPLATAMRQASLEAAAKANLSKTQARAALKSKSREPESSASLPSASDSTSGLLGKLDNAAPGGAIPPSGTTEPGEAVEVNKASDGKKEAYAVRFKGAEKKSGGLEKPAEMTAHKAEDASGASGEESGKVTAEQEEEEGKVDGDKAGQVKTEDATAATDEAAGLPGTRTQEQGAAEGGRVEESVAN